MADKKISELTNITGANLANNDEFVVVDVSADETKAVTREEFFKSIPSGTFTGNLTVDTNTLFVDAANNRVGVGTSSPAAKLDVSNSGTSTDINITNTSDDSAARATVLEFAFSDGAGAGIQATRATGLAASDTFLAFRAGGNTNAQERMRITSAGHAIIPAGITLGTAVGVYNADKTLDDYEEGTWTPGVNAYSGTPTTSGYYTKIGQQVTLEGSVQLDGTSDASVVRFSGLPFTVASPYLGGAYLTYNSGGVADVIVNIDTGSRLELRNSSGTQLSFNTIGASALLTFVVSYRAA